MPTVSDYMSREILDVPAEASVVSAARTMSEHKVSCLLVTQNGSQAGIVTERDLVHKVLAIGRTPHETKVSEVMSSPLITISDDASTKEAARRMVTHHIRRLPVVSDGRIVGIITATDLTRSILGAIAL